MADDTTYFVNRPDLLLRDSVSFPDKNIDCRLTLESNTFYVVVTGRSLSLPGENSSGASGSGVHLIKHHVLQFLIIHRSKVDISLQRLPEETHISK